MARFESQYRRALWFGLLVSFLVDYAIAYAVAWFFAESSVAAAGLAIVFLIAVYCFHAGYSIIAALKEVAFFYLFEKEKRVSGYVQSMADAKMPKPDGYYADAASYLTNVVNDSDASSRAKFLAGTTIGTLQGYKLVGKYVQSMTLQIVLEEAIERYDVHPPSSLNP